MTPGRGAWLVLAATLLGCAPQTTTVVPPLYALDPVRTDQPRSVTVLLPGALTTSRIFGAARDWGDARNLVIEYRLPGLQGEPLDPALQIARSADWVAAYANRFPDARINLLGYSTGAVIAIEAAGRITDSHRVKVVAISSATPFPGAALAATRGGAEVVGSALAAGSLKRDRIWEEYFKTLYFGKGWRASPDKRALAERLVAALRGRLITPGEGKGRAQSASLLFWAPSDRALASDAAIRFYHGDRDPVFPLPQARRLAGQLGAELCLLPEGGHLVLQSHPGVVDAARAYFLGPGPGTPCN